MRTGENMSRLTNLLDLSRALEQEEQLRRQRRTAPIAIEAFEKRVVLGLLEDQLAREALGQALREARLADADRAFDDDVARPVERDRIVARPRSSHRRGARRPPPASSRFSRVAKLDDNVVHLVLPAASPPPAATSATLGGASSSTACSALPAAGSGSRSTSRRFRDRLRRSSPAARGSRRPLGIACAAAAAPRARRAR